MNVVNLVSVYGAAMDFQKVLVWSIAFLQWISLPLAILGVQNLVRKFMGRNHILLNVTLSILTILFIVLVPLGLLGLLPLNSLFDEYKYAAAVGGLLSIPLTRFVRTLDVTKDHFR